MCERIEKRTEEVAMLAPSLTSPTDSEQVPSKRRRRTQNAPLLGALQDTVFLAPDAWPLVRHACLRACYGVDSVRDDIWEEA